MASFPAVAYPPTASAGSRCKPGFFLPVRVLSRLFRRRFLEELDQAHRGGRLQFFGEYAALSRSRARSPNGSRRCATCEWVVYAKRPFAGPAAVLAYLSRYTHRVAISNQRLLALDERGVTFRWKDYRATGKTRYKTMTLGADEFMRRFLLHVLPSGFHRIRHYGLLANAGRREHLARARELLHVVPAATEPQPTERRSAIVQPTFVCPHCGAAMSIIETFARGATDPRAAHVASCSMITGIGCSTRTSALHRPPPIADGFALRGRNRASRPLHHRQNPASHHRHPACGAMSSADCIDRSSPSRPTANHQIPIALSLPERHRGMPRFPPSRLVRRLPARRRHVLARSAREGRHRTTLNRSGHSLAALISATDPASWLGDCERVALPRVSRREPPLEPPHPLRGNAVRCKLTYDLGGRHAFLEISRLEQAALLHEMRPDSCVAVGL